MFDEQEKQPTGSQKQASTGSHSYQPELPICSECYKNAKRMADLDDKLAISMGLFPATRDMANCYEVEYRVVHLEHDGCHPYNPKSKAVRAKGRILPFGVRADQRQAKG